ncbi:MAG: YggS family pyridoxal phosphate-dependent enzyme [bacterium]|nr:YggS family pyridoxal phosphate-dependent enzyme [bacterium]
MNIAERWRALEEDVARFARGPVTIVAVTKQRPLADIREVLAAGARVLGENRVEEARAKFTEWDPRRDLPNLQLHMIGHVQSRKARDVVVLFDCVQSVDSRHLAEELHRRCTAAQRSLDILVEVNMSGETQKYGVAPSEVRSLVATCNALPSLRLRGLMTMAPFTSDETILRRVFSGLRLLRDALASEGLLPPNAELSMGMSNDYRIALEEGSTMIRIGTALFCPPA